MSRATEIGAHVLLFFLVFGMSATVDIGQMKKQLRNWRALMIGLSLQFVFLPFVGFCIVKMLRMDAAIGVTLLVVTSSPGGSYSNCK
jgi:predicted Na+-dependent transporter